MRELSEQEIVRIHEDHVRRCLAEIEAAGDVAVFVNTGPLIPACNAARPYVGTRCAPGDAILTPLQGCPWPALCACNYRAANAPQELSDWLPDAEN